VLPGTLQLLACSHNQLSSLPALPNSILNLSCQHNHLSILPALPDSLTQLTCSYNSLTGLPALPNTLTSLNCEFNQLGSFPDLPDSMFILYCDNNPNLYCFPLIKIIGDLEFYNTGLTGNCVPNYGSVNVSNPSLASIPLCQSGNMHGCLVISSVKEITQPVISVFPNPAQNGFTLSVDQDLDDASFELTDVSGKEISRRLVSGSSLWISTAQLPAGLYFIKLSDARGHLAVSKVIVE
jgi:hypothetical protein